MVQFIRNIMGIALAALVLLTIADFAYTKLRPCAAPTSKIALIKTYAGQKVDYVFVGSSRVNNTIIPEVIRQRTGKTALNLGVSSARPHDVLTIVRLLKEYDIRCDTIFIQDDYGFNHLDSSPTFEFEAMPYLWEDALLHDHIGYRPDAFALRYVPFYRYAAYDQKLGMRPLYIALTAKRPNGLEKNRGYMVRKGQKLLKEYALPDTIAARNPYHDTLCAYAAKEKLHLVHFTSPFMMRVRNNGFTAKLKTKIPGLHDYSRAIKADSLFSNQSHLNDGGARFFTGMLVDDLILRKR